MDATLRDFFKEFSSKNCYKLWMVSAQCTRAVGDFFHEPLLTHTHTQRLCSLPQSAADSAVQDQLQVSRAWSTLLVVGASQERLFHLTDPELQALLLEELLTAVASHLSPQPPASPPSQPNSPPPRAPSPSGVLIAEELSVLSVVLMKKWVDGSVQLGPSVVPSLVSILASCGGLDVTVSCGLLFNVYSCLIHLMSTRRVAMREQPLKGKGESLCMGEQPSVTCFQPADLLEPKSISDLISHLDGTFKNHSLYLRMDCKQRVGPATPT